MAKRSPQRTGLEVRVGADGVESFRASVRIPGTKLKARSGWTTSLAEARAARAQLTLASQAGALEPAQNFPTLREAWATFYADAREGRAWTRSGTPYKPRTLAGYREKMDLHVLPRFGDVPIDRLRRSELQRFLDEVSALQSGQSARNTATPVQALYRHLLVRHDDLQDPTIGLQLPRGSDPRDRIATPDELGVLLDALDGTDAVVFALASLAGLRHAEIRQLDKGAVLLDARAIEVRASKTDAGERLVPIFDPLVPYLEGQLVRVPGSHEAPLFPGRGASGRLSLSESLRRSCARWEKVELDPLGLHEGRHTFASLLIVAGYDVASVSEWIGHSRASTTLDRYVKPLRKRGVDPAAANAFLGPLPWGGCESATLR